MNTAKKLVLILALIGLQGCAVISKHECLVGDWHRVGFDVAMEGERDADKAYEKRAKVCAKHGEIANRDDYDAGYAEGLYAYCEVENAVKLGVRGKNSAFEICSEEENPGFTAAFEAGYQLNKLRREEAYAQNQLQRIENEENRVRRRIGDIRQSIDGSSSEQQRRDAERRVRHLRRDVRSLRYDADGWRERYYRAKEAADAYEQYLELEYEEI